MPDRRWSRRPVAALALTAGALTLALASPAAISAEADWADSAFSEETKAIHAEETFAVEGALIRAQGDGEITEPEVRDVRLTFSFQEGQEDDFDVGCIPDPTVNADVVQEESYDETTGTSTRTFSLPPGFVWWCNGTFDVVASGTSSPPDTFDLFGKIRVAVPPARVPSMEATVAGGEDAPDPETGATADDPATVEVSWQQLESPDTDYPDFVGYRVQRAGPAGDSKFETVGNEVIDHDPELVTQEAPQQVTDTIEAPGVYRYRVQSLRAGPDGTGPTQVVAASVEEPVSVEIAGPPTTTTPTTAAGPPTTRRSLALPDVGRGTNNPRSPLAVPAVPTTLDTGFDETLDYGELPEPGEELAGEGQSVIQNEGEGAGLLGPVAGAMVLLGWAGHVAYLNRLAKQF